MEGCSSVQLLSFTQNQEESWLYLKRFEQFRMVRLMLPDEVRRGRTGQEGASNTDAQSANVPTRRLIRFEITPVWLSCNTKISAEFEGNWTANGSFECREIDLGSA